MRHIAEKFPVGHHFAMAHVDVFHICEIFEQISDLVVNGGGADALDVGIVRMVRNQDAPDDLCLRKLIAEFSKHFIVEPAVVQKQPGAGIV